MKNKVVRKLLMVGLSSSVVLTSTVGVAAAATDTDTVVVEDSVTLDDETLAPVKMKKHRKKTSQMRQKIQRIHPQPELYG